MATNLVNYIGNLGKSVAYSTVDKFSKMAPATTEFVKTNNELYKSVYENIRDYKTTYKRTGSYIKSSKVYEAGNVFLHALVDDITTGKLYNRERQEKMDARATGFAEGGNTDDWGSFDMGIDDSEFDLGEGDEDFGSFTLGDEMISDSVKKSSEANANAVSMAIARTGEYIVENNKMQNNLLFSQNIQAFSNINNGLNAVNENMGKMLEFSNQVLKTHVDNSTKFYDSTTQQLQQQTSYLKQIVDAVTVTPKEEKTKDNITFEDILGSEGAPDLKKYFSVIKKNAKNMMGAVPNMDFGGGGNPLLAFEYIAQPLKIIPDMIVSKMIPKMVETAVQDFDKSISNYFGAAMLKVNGLKNSENPLMQKIGQLFGVANGLKSDVDTSTYEKGKVAWDGKSKKALEEVIPTHLARIESLLSGKGERRFDYNKGVFIDVAGIKKDFDRVKESYSERSSSDMMDEFKKYLDMLTFNSKSEKDKLDEDIKKIFDTMYKTGQMFDVNNKNFDDMAYDYGVDSKNLRIFRALFRQAPNNKKLGINNEIMRNRQKQTSYLNDLEKQGSIYGALYNGLPLNEFYKKNDTTGEETSLGLFGKDSLNQTKDNLGHNIFYYLQNLMGDLNYIRKNGSGFGMPGASAGPRQLIASDGTRRTISRYDSTIPDDSVKTRAQEIRESKEREAINFRNKEERRRKKNEDLLNVSDFEGTDKEFENIFKTRMERRDIENDLKSRNNNKESIFDDLIGKSLMEKWNVVMDKGTNFLNKPMKFVSSVLRKADQHLYESIYGSDDGENRGFMDLLVNSTKNTFRRVNTWIDDNVLEPIKKKLEVESLKDVGKKFFGMFGIDLDETGKKIKTYFFGNKDTGEKGLFSNIGDGFKDTFGNAFKYMKDSVSGTFKELTKPFRDKFKSRKAAFKNAEQNDDEVTTGEEQEQQIATPNLTTSYNTKDFIENNIIGKKNVTTTQEDYNMLFNSSPQQQKQKILQQIRDIKKKVNEAKLDLQTMPSNTGKNKKKYITNFISDAENKIKSLKSQLNGISGKSGFQMNEERIKPILDKIRDKQEMRFQFSKEVIPDAPVHTTDLAQMEKNFPNLINGDISKEEMGTNSFTSFQEKSTSYLKDIRDFLLSLRGGKTNKPSNTPNILPVNNLDRDPDESGVLKNTANDLATVIYNFLQGNTKGHATGSNILKEPELATLNEGELVLNKEQTSSISKLMNTLMTSLGTAGNNLSDIAASGYKKFNKLKDSVGDDIDITNFGEMSKYASDDVKSKYGKVINLEQYKKVMGLMDKQRNLDNNVDEKGVPLDPIQKALYQDVKPFVTEIGEEFKTGVKNIRISLFGKSPEDDSEKFKAMVGDVSENISEYAPKMLPAAVLGSGVSLITGAIGGPLLGAAVGAGTSLAINSEKVQTWLLGDKVADERTGGVIPKGVIDVVQKYLPDAGKYGTFGAIASLFTPLGLVGGLAVGAGASFVKNNESVQDMLFGESGLFDEKQKEKMKKMLPRLGLGALIGATVGPFGLVGNAVLGSAAGMATTSNKFNEAIMGKYNDKTGEYEGGILPTLREKFVLPVTTFGDDMKTKFMYFLDNDIIDPLKRAFEPLKRGSKIIINNMVRGMGHAIDWVFEKSFGTPLSKLAQSVTSKISGFVKGLGKGALGLAKGSVKKLFGAVGLAGDVATRRQIASGNAYDLTAEQRLAKMNGRNYRFRNLDQMLVNGDLQGTTKARDDLQTLLDLNKSDKKKRKEMAIETGDTISSFFNYGDTHNIMGAFRDGDNSKIDDILHNSVANKRASIQKVNDKVLKYYEAGMKSINSQAKSKNWNEKDIEYKTIKLKDSIKSKYLKDFDVRTQKEILDRLGDSSKFTKFMDMKSATLNDEAKKMSEYISGQQSKFNTFRKNKANKDQVLSNLQTQLGSLGIDVNTASEKDMDKLYQMLNKEINNLNKKPEDNKKDDNDEDVVGSTDKVLSQRHTQIVDLFSETIKVLKSINGEEEKSSPIDTTDPAKTINNIINDKSSSNDKKETIIGKTNADGIITHIDDNGNVLQYKQEKNGDISPNLSDSSTRKSLMEKATEQKQQKGFFSGIKDKIFGKKDDEEEEIGKKKGKISKIKDFFSDNGGGIVKTLGMVFGGGFILEQLAKSGVLDKFITTFAPKIGSLISESVAVALPTILHSGVEIIKGSLPALGSALRTAIFPQLDNGDKVGVEETDKSLMSNGIVRNIAKGGKGLTKLASRTKFKATDLLHPISGTFKAGTNILSRGGSLIGKGVQKITNPIDNSKLATIFKDKIAKNGVTKVFTEQTAKIGLESSEKIVSKFGSKFAEKLVDIFDSKAVRSLLGDYSEKLITEFVPTFAEKVSKKAATGAAKATGRLAAAVSTGGILTAAFAVTDFISGYNDACNILKITPEQLDQLGMFPKVTSGLIKSLLGAFLISSFVPEEWIVPTVVNLLAPIFGLDKETIDQMQQQTQNDIKTYNEQNNTNYDVRQYNHDVKGHKTIGEKVGFNVKDIMSGKGLISKVANPLGSIVRLVGDASKKLGFEKFGNAVTGSLDWVGEKVDNGLDWIGNGIKGLFTRKPKGYTADSGQSQMVTTVEPGQGGPKDLIDTYSGMGGPTGDMELSDNIGPVNVSSDKFTNAGLSNNFNMNTNSALDVLKGLKSKMSNTKPVESANNNTTVISSILDKSKKFIMSILNNVAVQTLLGADNAKLLYDKFIPTLMDFLQVNLSKNIDKLNTKVTSMLTSGGLLDKTFAVSDFMSGFNDAGATLGVSEPTVGMKVSAGLLRAFTGFICLSFIPESSWIDLFSNNILPLFSKGDSELEKLRNQTQKQLDDYNMKNNTDLSSQDFIKMTSNSGNSQGIIGNIKNNTKALYQQVKNGASYIWNKGKSAVNSIKNGAEYWWNQGKAALGFGGPKDNDLRNPLYDFDYDKEYKGKGGPSNNPKSKDFHGYGLGGPYSGMGGPEISNNSDFLNYVIPGAQKAYEQYGIFPSVMIAQAINESGWGKSKLAKTDNNLFGIKQPGAHDPSLDVQKGSWATDDGGNYAKYSSWDDSMKDHGYFLKNNSRYSDAGVFDASNPEEQISAIKKAGYASDPKYVSTTMSIINSNNLTQYDTGEYKGSSSSNSSSDSDKFSGSMMTDLGNLFNSSVSKLLGMDTGSSSSSGGSASVTNDKVDTSNLSGAVKTVIDAAASKIGCPYVWGGTGALLTQAIVNSFKGTDHDISKGQNWQSWIGKEGYDCSGLMQYAFSKANIDIGRSTYDQIKKGTRIDVNKAEAGDLVFFGQESAPHHVGVSIGDGKFIESPSSGQTVRVSNVSDRKDACCAKRVIQNGQGGLLSKFSDKKKTFKAKYDVKNAIGGPADTFFSKTLKGNVTSNFGFRNTRGSIGRNHTGIDIGAKMGQDIKSPIGGVVTKKVAPSESNGYGNLVTVRDSNGAEHYFGHMENPTNLKPGDTIKPGQKLGNVGNTGNSTGSHLHYEVKKSGISVDPNKYLANKGIGGENDTPSTNTMDNTALLKSIIAILSKIAQNTISITDIFTILKAMTPNQDSSKSENSTAVKQQNYQDTQTQLTNLLKKTTNQTNEIGDQELLNILTTLAKG